MTPKRRKTDVENKLREFTRLRLHAGYGLAFLITLGGSSYFKEWVTWQFQINERVSAIEVDRARLIEKSIAEKALLRKDMEDQISVIREDVRELRKAHIKPTKD